MENKKFLSESKIKIRWSDIDMYNHLNNSKFFDYMVEARADLFSDIANEISHVRYILVDVRCMFLKEFKRLQIRVFTGNLESCFWLSN